MSAQAQRYNAAFEQTFLEFVARRELRYACCGECRRALAYTQRLCGRHPRAGVQWQLASGHATLHTYAVYRIGYAANFEPPYTVAVAQLAEGPRLTGLLAPSTTSPRVGCRLAALFDTDGRLTFRINH